MRYRKRPVIVEARQLGNDYDEDLAIMKWCGGEYASEDEITENDHALFTIPTLEGRLLAGFGDYIICGIKGEFYPCKPDIFEATYEEVHGEG